MSIFKELLFTAIVATIFAFPVYAADPPVKKSKSDICHPKGGRYYNQTKKYTAYQTMEKCIASGGRKAKK